MPFDDADWAPAADIAKPEAQAAQTTADTATTKADAAQTTADTATTKADAAQKTAASLSKLIRETEDGVDVGKSADGTTYAEGSMVTRQGTDGTFSILKVISGVLTSVASFGESLVELGKNSTSAVIKFCAGKLSISYATNTSGVDNATISSSDGILVTSEASTTAECLHTLTTAEGNEGFLPAGTRISAYASVAPYDDKAGASADLVLDCTQPDGSENYLNISLLSGCRLNGTTHEPNVSLSMSTKDGSAAATSYSAQVPFRRFITAIQPVVLYNGGAALNYDTAPGAGTTGTVTLSETAANFKELTIFYNYSGVQSSVTLHSTNGLQAGLYLMFLNGTVLWIKTRILRVSGTTVSNTGQAANYAVDMTTGACVYHGLFDTPEIIIDRVEGRR